jgi:Holliday junction resolvase RusA-like endonuclease
MLRDGAIWLDIKAFYPIPKSVKKADREQIAAGKYKITKGDIDNVIKAISDALNGVAYTDDARIAKISGEKRYSEDARVEVTLYELND